MPYWLKVILWTLLGVVVSCSLAIGVVAFAINRIYGRNEAEDARIAPIIVDKPIGDCSISPARNFVLATAFTDGRGSQKIYNLKTGDEVEYPANSYGIDAYSNELGWINDSTQDIVLVDPYWLVNLTTGAVTKAELPDDQQTTAGWDSLLMSDYRETYLKSPDQQYVAHSGQISRSAIGKSPVGDLVVSYSNNYPEICSNAWEPDSSGYYFADVYGRNRMSGPLRFLKNPER